MSQAERIIRILAILSGGSSYTISDIAQRLLPYKTHVRNLQRDMQILAQEESVKLYSENKDGKVYYRLRDHSWRLPPSINQEEIITFYILRAFLGELLGTSAAEPVESLRKKLESLTAEVDYLPDGRPGVPGASDLIWDQNVGQYNYSLTTNVLGDIIRAIADGKPVSVEYQREEEANPTTFDVYFHRLFLYRGSIYVACDLLHKKIVGSLTVQSIKKVGAATETYDQHFTFDFEKFRKQRFGVYDDKKSLTGVTLKIRKDFVKHFENRRWHMSQQLTKLGDGSMELTMTVPLSPELISWIMSWGHGLTVVGPEELKQEVKEALQNSLSQY